MDSSLVAIILCALVALKGRDAIRKNAEEMRSNFWAVFGRR